MGNEAGPIRINVGDVIKDQFVVKKKVGEGACGQVFKMEIIKDGKPAGRVAMKVEALMKSRDDEILKMEVVVLRKMQKSRHVCRFYAAGKTSSYTYLIMSLLGRELSDIRRRLPNRKMNVNSILRISLQTIKAIEELHDAGFLHRDVKPSNLSMGYSNRNVVYIFDFGLSRKITTDDGKLREPRTKVMFRGTVRYCSLNVHQFKEQGRHDDLFSVIYSMIELHTGSLPWKGTLRKEAGKIKETTSEEKVCKECPGMFVDILKDLKRLTYHDKPNYDKYMKYMKDDIKRMGIKMTDPFEWEEILRGKGKKSVMAEVKAEEEAGERAEMDKTADGDTLKEVDDSVVTEGSEAEENFKGFDKEDTLDGLE